MVRKPTDLPLDPVTGIVSDLKHFLEPYRDKVLFAYLFGSAAKGEAVAGSDLDLAVYFADRRPQSHHGTRIDIYMTLSRSLRKNDIDIVVLNTASNLMLIDEIVRLGIVLVDGDPAFREEFELRAQHRAMDFREQRKAVMGV